MFNKQYFFHGRDLPDQLVKITEVVGSDDILSFCDKYSVDCPNCVKKEMMDEKYGRFDHKIPKKEWTSFVAENKKGKFISDEAIDLLDKLLIVDPKDRITASEAMKHPYFDKIRDKLDSDSIPTFEDDNQNKAS